MYLIVVGAGNIGQPLIQIATAQDHEVVVVEQEIERAEAIAGECDCLVIQADATIKDTLVEAGAAEADALVSTTDHDATNIMVCLLAQELEVPRLVSVVHRAEDLPVFRQIGVHAMENPQRLIAEYLFRAVSYPSVRDYMRVGEGAEIFEIEVSEDAPIVGHSLQEAARARILSDDVLVVAIDRPETGQVAVPRGNTRIQAGDLVVVYSASGSKGRVLQAFQPAAT